MSAVLSMAEQQEKEKRRGRLELKTGLDWIYRNGGLLQLDYSSKPAESVSRKTALLHTIRNNNNCLTAR